MGISMAKNRRMSPSQKWGSFLIPFQRHWRKGKVVYVWSFFDCRWFRFNFTTLIEGKVINNIHVANLDNLADDAYDVAVYEVYASNVFPMWLFAITHPFLFIKSCIGML